MATAVALGSGVAAFITDDGGKASVVVAVTPDLTGRFDAVALVRAATKKTRLGVLYFGSTAPAMDEALHTLAGQHVRQAVEGCEGNLSQAARRLGISRNTLYRKLGELGLR
mgnify:CR=1 FL=1